MQRIRRLAVLALAFVLSGTLSGAALLPQQKKKESPTESAKPPVQKLTVDVAGADCSSCIETMTKALEDAGMKLQGKLKPAAADTDTKTQEKPKPAPSNLARAVVTAPTDADLTAAATKVNAAMTMHQEKSPPGLFLVLFAKLDEKSAKGATEAVSKIKGVDAKGSKADEKKGEISVKIAGKASPKLGESKPGESKSREPETKPGEQKQQPLRAQLTVAVILKSLKDAGIEARTEAGPPLASR